MEAEHGVVLHQQVVRRQLRHPAGRVADDDVATLEGHDPPGCIEQVAADGVEDDVDATAAGLGPHGATRSKPSARLSQATSAPWSLASRTLATPPAVASTRAPAAAASCIGRGPSGAGGGVDQHVCPASRPPRWNRPTQAVP